MRRGAGRPSGTFHVRRDAPPSLAAFLAVGDRELELVAQIGDRAWRGTFAVRSVAAHHAAIAVGLRPR